LERSLELNKQVLGSGTEPAAAVASIAVRGKSIKAKAERRSESQYTEKRADDQRDRTRK
jgi:hypothetical protein